MATQSTLPASPVYSLVAGSVDPSPGSSVCPMVARSLTSSPCSDTMDDALFSSLLTGYDRGGRHRYLSRRAEESREPVGQGAYLSEGNSVWFVCCGVSAL